MEDQPTGNSLAIVTLSRDNPAELMRTVLSVELQTTAPDRYLVIDSSSSEVSPIMESIAKISGAEYFWVPPRGIYSAMNESISLAAGSSYVWWLNSSDWLSGQEVVKRVASALMDSAGNEAPAWLVGQLIRWSPSILGVHNVGNSEAQFQDRFGKGRAGFPHPSAIFKASLLDPEIDYRGGYTVAEDYKLGLRFLYEHGPPKILKNILAVHVPDGFSYTHPFLHNLEKSQIRFASIPNWNIARELRGLTKGVGTTIGERFGLFSPTRSATKLLRATNPGDTHFCLDRSPGSWPICCFDYI